MPANSDVLAAGECPSADLAGGVADAAAVVGDANVSTQATTIAAKPGEPATPKLAKLKKQHATHLLGVVRSAEKQEAERQKKLRHATSKGNLAYLQKRFTAERRHDQTQITRLLHDADAIESALLKAAAHPPEHRSRQRYSADGCHQNASWFGEDDTSAEAGGIPGGGQGGRGGTVGGTSSTGPNACLDGCPKRDPNLVSLEQVRFMEQLYKHVNDQKAARAQARLVTQIEKANHPNSTCQLRGRRGGGPNEPDRKRWSTPVPGGTRTARTTTTATFSGRGIDVRIGGSDMGYFSGAGRRRLLKKKREILTELKGVVDRQAKAMDRLVERCGPVSCSYDGLTRINTSLPSARISHGAFGSKPTYSLASSTNDHSTCGGKNTTARITCRSSTSSQSVRDPPRRAEEDATSAFLAHGGRWGTEPAPTVPRRHKSVASSASYATYAERSSARGGLIRGACRRPGAMPTLPIGTG